MSCNNETKNKTHKTPQWKEPKSVAYTFQNTTDWLLKNIKNSSNTKEMELVLAVNRLDETNLKKSDSILVPTDSSGDKPFYMPFPLKVTTLQNVKKILLFSYPSQSFAAYEYGDLVYTGPTSMGSAIHKTPTGLYFTNWKAEATTSTFNDEWKLKWNFNIDNKEGVGFHEYELPGVPASHSCLRLLETDAKFLYNWADQWVLADAETVKTKGTPVIIFGTYNFNAPKPWLVLASNPKALNISENIIETLLKTHLKTIQEEQSKTN